ncbi:putative C6 transcription factor (NirA) [Aspergillus candidus]|uniref:Nitrogen assimilation transcription factor nirA n=1 Tax=Aspergillus candidus TaxID=41067 RepID=A0A2I2FN48_ASPCN|nr:nitrogen assimilation transcription factor nirA [Aspergillus candidus]PLB42058.1 nitrogen assimilation transcription factor nirA [Aspergillus candidus]
MGWAMIVDHSMEKTPDVKMDPTPDRPRGKLSAADQEMNPTHGSASKRRCVSTACIACRKRKSKCDGNLPSCAACSSVYHSTCVYDPNSDHRRKGVYKKDTDALKTKNTTLLTLIQALLNFEEEEDAFDLVRQIRSCDNLEDVAHSVVSRERGSMRAAREATSNEDGTVAQADQFEAELAGKVGELVLDGSRKFIGGTSNLIFLPVGSELNESGSAMEGPILGQTPDFSVTQWTRVTQNEQLVSHLMTMYFTWHYPFFTTLSKDLFYRDFVRGVSGQYCSSLLVNAMLALGCHFSTWEGAWEDPLNSATAGDHFFKEAKSLFFENDELANAKLCTVQALSLMSVREAGCGREGRGWFYSGMSFRMALDLGLNLDAPSIGSRSLGEDEIDARRMTFWGCFLFDKCWSNYLGRQPQLPSANVSVPKFDVMMNEEAELWSPYTDSGPSREHTQPSRTRAVALQISKLSEISGDLIAFFYDPTPRDKAASRQLEIKRLSEIHTRLEAWKKGLPKELEAREGQLPQVLLMHMFYQLLFIHLYRPFLKYTKSNSPLPPHVSPRKLCTQAASVISKLLRTYKRTYGFKQICNIVVYIAHTTCTIHLLNLPERNAQRDVIHALRHLEEMGECWPCARRTLRILDISAHKWQVELPDEAVTIFEQTHARWGSWGSWDQGASPSSVEESPPAVIPNTYHPPPEILYNEPTTTSSPMQGVPPPPPTSVGSMALSYPPPGLPMPVSVPSMREAQRSLGAHLSRPNAPLPEPTYLRPVAHPYTNNPIPYNPFAQPEAWFTPNEGQQNLHVLGSTQQDLPATSNPTPGSGFEAPEDPMDETHAWWLPDPSTMDFGLGSNWP